MKLETILATITAAFSCGGCLLSFVVLCVLASILKAIGVSDSISWLPALIGVVLFWVLFGKGAQSFIDKLINRD
jgi:hypothetical protein